MTRVAANIVCELFAGKARYAVQSFPTKSCPKDTPMPPTEWETSRDHFITERIRKSYVIDAQDVADLVAGMTQEQSSLTTFERQAISLRPPFDNLLFAWREGETERCTLVGWFERADGRVNLSGFSFKRHGSEVRNVTQWTVEVDTDGNPNWSNASVIDEVSLWDFLQRGHDRREAVAALMERFSDPKEADAEIEARFGSGRLDEDCDVFRNRFKEMWLEHEIVPVFVLQLLNCRNVNAKEKPCSPAQLKSFRKRHGYTRPKYYVLDIEPMKKVIRNESGGDPVTLARALHICRGHFKNFDEKPLFGKLKGTYWWQPHLRGTSEAGVVEKDYRIKLPNVGNQ